MSYTPTPQYSIPSSSFPPSSTSTPPPPPPKPQAPQHGRSGSTNLAYTAPPPPPPRPSNPDAYGDVAGRPYTPGVATSAGATEDQQQGHPLSNQYQLPPFLNTLSTPDLHYLLQNPTLLDALLHAPTTSPSTISQHSTPSLLAALHTNTQLAHTLLPLLHHLQQLRAATTRHLLQVRALEQAWKLKQHELEEKLEPLGPRTLHARLNKEIAEGEAGCVAIEESFLEGGGAEASEREVGEWIRRVREGRELWWRRTCRRERWDEGRVGGWR